MASRMTTTCSCSALQKFASYRSSLVTPAKSWCFHIIFNFYYFILQFCQFAFGCAGCLLLPRLFSTVARRGCSLAVGGLAAPWRWLRLLKNTVFRHRDQEIHLVGTGAQAQSLRGTSLAAPQDEESSGLGTKPVSLIPAGRLSTTEPPGEPYFIFFFFQSKKKKKKRSLGNEKLAKMFQYS